jgi:hypothetical protein
MAFIKIGDVVPIKILSTEEMKKEQEKIQKNAEEENKDSSKDKLK